MAASSKKHYMMIRGNVVVHTLIAFAKRGIATEDWIGRVSEELDNEAGTPLRLASQTLSLIYRAYGRYIDSNKARSIFRSWGNQLPAEAIRTKVVINQASKSGLTAYFVILEAMVKFGDFDWSKVLHLYNKDRQSFDEAVKKIRSDVFYGFNANIGNVASSRYRNLAYVAKELLIKGDGQVALARYGGWTRSPLHKDIIDPLITGYLERRSASLLDAPVAQLPEEYMTNIQQVWEGSDVV